MSKSLKKIPTLEFNIYFQLYIESVALTFKQDAYAFANMKSRKQIQFSGKGFKPEKSDHGGDLPHARNRKRPLGVRSTMHLVLRSSKAKNHWSFEKFDREIQQLLIKFARKNHIQILSVANVGNHLHLHIRVRGRKLFRAFIRAVTAAIMMKVTGYTVGGNLLLKAFSSGTLGPSLVLSVLGLNF